MEAPQVQIDTSMGSFTVELYYKHAPRTVKNFLELSRRGYYDGVKVRLRYLQASIRGPAQHSRSVDESKYLGLATAGPATGRCCRGSCSADQQQMCGAVKAYSSSYSSCHSSRENPSGL